MVIHPRFTVYGGGEMIALHVIKALEDSGLSVSLVTDNYQPQEVEKNFGMGRILERCAPILVPRFHPLIPRLLALQRLRYSSEVMRVVKGLDVDIAFSTQSVLYYLPRMVTYHIVYDMADLFETLGGRERGPLGSFWKKPYYQLLRVILARDLQANRFFVPLSGALREELSRRKYPHSPVVYPPCDLIFRPRPKKKQVCLVTRIAPQKNIEEFMKIAEMVPNLRFVLVGVEAHAEQQYARAVLRIRPRNVEYIEARIRDRPELLEESKIYLYTSYEPGIGIALGQAMGAGCIPVTPAWGGGAEMVAAANVGYTYRERKEAAKTVSMAIESHAERDLPEQIAERSKIFSSENFERQVTKILKT